MTWIPLPSTELVKEKQLPIVVTGSIVDGHPYLENPINLFSENSAYCAKSNELNCAINELVRLSSEYRNYELSPIGHSFNSHIGIQLISTKIYFKRSLSTFTLVLGIKSSDRIVEHSKLPSCNIVIPDITPKQMLDKVIPQFQDLENDSKRLLFGMSDFLIKQFFAENGIMIPGTHVI